MNSTRLLFQFFLSKSETNGGSILSFLPEVMGLVVTAICQDSPVTGWLSALSSVSVRPDWNSAADGQGNNIGMRVRVCFHWLRQLSFHSVSCHSLWWEELRETFIPSWLKRRIQIHPVSSQSSVCPFLPSSWQYSPVQWHRSKLAAASRWPSSESQPHCSSALIYSEAKLK